MHFSITAAFGGRLATLLKLAHQSQQLGHMPLLVAICFSSSANSVSKGARLARTSVTRHSSRKSSVFVGSSLVIQGLHLCRVQRAACSQDGQRLALLHAPNAAPFWNKLGFEQLVLMVRRLVFTCVVNDRRPSFQCTPVATTSGPCVHSAPAAL